MEVKTQETKEQESADVLEMPVRPRFSAGEINSLFLGLCRLVRRCALEEAEEIFEKKLHETKRQMSIQISNLKLINQGLMQELTKKNPS